MFRQPPGSQVLPNIMKRNLKVQTGGGHQSHFSKLHPHVFLWLLSRVLPSPRFRVSRLSWAGPVTVIRSALFMAAFSRRSRWGGVTERKPPRFGHHSALVRITSARRRVFRCRPLPLRSLMDFISRVAGHHKATSVARPFRSFGSSWQTRGFVVVTREDVGRARAMPSVCSLASVEAVPVPFSARVESLWRRTKQLTP